MIISKDMERRVGREKPKEKAEKEVWRRNGGRRRRKGGKRRKVRGRRKTGGGRRRTEGKRMRKSQRKDICRSLKAKSHIDKIMNLLAVLFKWNSEWD